MSEYAVESSSVTCDQGPTAAVASLSPMASSGGLSTVADGTGECAVVPGIVATDGLPRSRSSDDDDDAAAAAAAGLKCEDEGSPKAAEESETNETHGVETTVNDGSQPSTRVEEGASAPTSTREDPKVMVKRILASEAQLLASGETDAVEDNTQSAAQSTGEGAAQIGEGSVAEIPVDASETNQGNNDDEGVPIPVVGQLKNDLDDNDDDDIAGDDSETASEDGMEEMTEEEEKSAMLNIVLSELLRKFREENGRGPNSQEVLEIRASVAEQLEIEVATIESLAEFRPKMQQQQADGKKRPGEETTANQPSPKKVKFEEMPVPEEEEPTTEGNISKPAAS